MRRVEATVVIRRPVDEVFEFATSPEHDSVWQSAMLESRQGSEGPVGMGAATWEVRRFLRQRFESTAEIIEYERNVRIGYRSTSGPIRYKAWYTFEAVPRGTRLTLVGEADTGGLTEAAAGLVMRAFQRDMQSAVATLKDVLEGRAEGGA